VVFLSRGKPKIYHGNHRLRHRYRGAQLSAHLLLSTLKGFRRIFSRFEKLDVVFLAFLCFALIVEALRLSVNTP
jgi:hypothetical protein